MIQKVTSQHRVGQLLGSAVWSHHPYKSEVAAKNLMKIPAEYHPQLSMSAAPKIYSPSVGGAQTMTTLEGLDHEIEVARESIETSLQQISAYTDLFQADKYNYRNVPGLLAECRELERHILALQAFSRVRRSECLQAST